MEHTLGHERAAKPLTERSGPLTDVRVIDLTAALAGPYCTMLLADLGADVIKVEPPKGDFTRSGGPFTKGDAEKNYGGYFASVNRSKRSIVLGLQTEEDRDTLRALVRDADVLVENFRPGVLDRLGVGYEALAEVNPRLVYGAVRGFGDPRTGESPLADWPAFDVIAQAMSGLVATTGEPGTFGTRVGPSIGDIFPASLLALGIVSAVHEARASGRGQFVDVAMYDALVALCEETVYRWSYWGRHDQPNGNAHPIHIPFGLFATADGAVAMAAPTTHWPILCEAIGRPDLIDDERTATNRSRNANRELVTEIVETWLGERTTADVLEALGGKVPVGPVNDNEMLFADPHLEAREMLVALETPGAERPTVFANSPIKFSRTKSGVNRRAPLLDEHGAEVRAELT
ncbi:MAG: CoA transferase [Acidimicrobiales bacterium]|nr:CoA transferase [Acidimicrobiales bacterium]